MNVATRVLPALLALGLPLGAATAEPPLGEDRPRQAEAGASAFERLVAEAGMVFRVPDGFQPVAPGADPLFSYERALINGDGSLEIRYAVRPLARIIVDYQDPHSATPDPNHMFPLMFQSVVGLLSNGRHTPSREYPREEARDRFNADWAAAAVFDVSTELDTHHQQALVVAMHKSKLADAYVIYLFDDYQQVKPQINAGLSSLRFVAQ